jgi:hypothetical protein
MKVYSREFDIGHLREGVNIMVRSAGTNAEFLER